MVTLYANKQIVNRENRTLKCSHINKPNNCYKLNASMNIINNIINKKHL